MMKTILTLTYFAILVPFIYGLISTRVHRINPEKATLKSLRATWHTQSGKWEIDRKSAVYLPAFTIDLAILAIACLPFIRKMAEYSETIHRYTAGLYFERNGYSETMASLAIAAMIILCIFLACSSLFAARAFMISKVSYGYNESGKRLQIRSDRGPLYFTVRLIYTIMMRRESYKRRVRAASRVR